MPTFHCMSLWEWGHCWCGSRHCAPCIFCFVFRREKTISYDFPHPSTPFFSYILLPCSQNQLWVIHYFRNVSITDTWTETQLTNWVHHMCHTDTQAALTWRDGIMVRQESGDVMVHTNPSSPLFLPRGWIYLWCRILIMQESKYIPRFIIKHNFLVHQSLSWLAECYVDIKNTPTTIQTTFVSCIFSMIGCSLPRPCDFLVSVVNPVLRWWPSHTQQSKKVSPLMALSCRVQWRRTFNEICSGGRL